MTSCPLLVIRETKRKRNGQLWLTTLKAVQGLARLWRGARHTHICAVTAFEPPFTHLTRCVRAEVLSLGSHTWSLHPTQRLAWEDGKGRTDLGLDSRATCELGRVPRPLSVLFHRQQWEAPVVVCHSALACCSAPGRWGKPRSTQHALGFLRFTS